MKTSVAAVPYYWSKASYQDFYHKLATTDVDIVYLGETVCSKRRSMKLNDWLEIATMLSASGKQAVLSTMTLLEAESELKYLSKIAAQKDFFIEANDTAAIQVANSNGNTFAVGNAINLYNNRALHRYAQQGMRRWCVPVELGKDDLQPMILQAKTIGVEIEYQVFGRMPLAYSARCFTARHHQLAKDNCQFKCLEDEQGILIKTQEGESFAQINGIQTQSAKVNLLIDQWKVMQELGIDILRVIPVSAEDTIEVVNQLTSIVNKCDNNSFDRKKLQHHYEFCNGYWLQIEGMKYAC